MTHRKKRTAVIALAAALPLSAGLVLAAGTGMASPQTSQPQTQTTPQGQPGTTQAGTNYGDVFLQRLAAQLGITAERLRTAVTSARNATIDQAVRNGDLPQDRAADLKSRLQDAPLNFGFGGRHGRGDLDGRMGDRGPRAAFGQAVFVAVARALGLSEQALRQQLQSGQTVAQLAQARGVSTQTVRNAALTALRTQLTAAVQAGRLTQAQADQLLAQAQADTNFGLTFGRGGRSGPGRDGWNGPRGFSQPGDQDTPSGAGADVPST